MGAMKKLYTERSLGVKAEPKWSKLSKKKGKKKASLPFPAGK